MDQRMIVFYENKLTRKESLLKRLQERENDIDYEMGLNETIQLNVYQAEVRLLKEFTEDMNQITI